MLPSKVVQFPVTIAFFTFQIPDIGYSYFEERLLETMQATITKGIVAGSEFTVLQRDLKEWHERPWTYVR